MEVRGGKVINRNGSSAVWGNGISLSVDNIAGSVLYIMKMRPHHLISLTNITDTHARCSTSTPRCWGAQVGTQQKEHMLLQIIST